MPKGRPGGNPDFGTQDAGQPHLVQAATINIDNLVSHVSLSEIEGCGQNLLEVLLGDKF